MRIYFVDEVDSTNSAIWSCERREGETVALISKRQSMGRGTKGRTWVSEEGNFFGSFLQRVSLKNTEPFSFSLRAGVLVVEALNSISNEKLKLLWPNDIIKGDKNDWKKVGGILCESRVLGSEMDLVVGVGINCNSFPKEAIKPAGKIDVDLENITAALIAYFEVLVPTVSLARFEELDFLRGKKVNVGNIQGIGMGLAPDLGYRLDIGETTYTIRDPERPEVF